jgi:hypothetical protein
VSSQPSCHIHELVGSRGLKAPPSVSIHRSGEVLSPRESRSCCLHRGSSLLNIQVPCSKICYIHSCAQLLATFFTLPVLEMPCVFPCAKRRPHLDAACHSHDVLSSATTSIVTFRYNAKNSLRQFNNDSHDFVPHHAYY